MQNLRLVAIVTVALLTRQSDQTLRRADQPTRGVMTPALFSLLAEVSSSRVIMLMSSLQATQVTGVAHQHVLYQSRPRNRRWKQ